LVDKTLLRGYISKEQILEYVSQEDIFQLVFGYKPIEYLHVTSPFRKDINPGCWFEVDVLTEKLRFVDFANKEVKNRIKMSNIDCFDAVTIFFKMPSFYHTLNFIKKELITNKKIKNKIFHREPAKKKVKKHTTITVNTRAFNYPDKVFWSKRYKITQKQLLSDKTFGVSKFKIDNPRKNINVIIPRTITYVYTGFQKDRKKIYSPYNTSNKFITNCNQEDVGGINTLSFLKNFLIITKSYKDYRVLKNLGLDVIWFQNEGAFPINKEFWKTINKYSEIIVFFDNDRAGEEASEKLLDYLKKGFFGITRRISFSKELLKQRIKDPSDSVHRKNIQYLINFLTNNNISI